MDKLADFQPGPLDRYRKQASFDWKQMKVFLLTEEMLTYEHSAKLVQILKMKDYLVSNINDLPKIKDFPPGPLDKYRKCASFDWKLLKLFLYPPENLQYEDDFYNEIQNNPIFNNDIQTPSLDEIRHIAMKRTFILKNMPFLKPSKVMGDARMPVHTSNVLFNVDPSTSVKLSVAFGMFTSVLTSLGTDRHLDILLENLKGNIVGCFALTEIGHGSNAKAMRTTATYNKESKEFIIHTPDFEAAKCWVGGLGQSSTHAVIYAQLITPDGVNHGLHAFVVQIRDSKTLLPLPGVIVGDLGEKIGLNGIDNGFVMFNQFHVPRMSLLNKVGDVTENGKYVTPFKDPSKRHGASLGALSAGRVNITNMCAIYAIKALTIAVRYAAIRKQFGPDGQDELPILEYQTHQNRLLPYLAYAYAIKIFGEYIVRIQYQFSLDSITGENRNLLAELGMELHAISSACKPVGAWTTRDCIQECRECCGGHGYLKASGIGDLRNDNDANLTYEGECHVLIQQTTNWLLKFWPMVLKGATISSPLKSVNFLTNALQILETKFTANSFEDVSQPQFIIHIFKWLTCYLLKMTYEKFEEMVKTGVDSFTAKNECQVYYARTLGVVYCQHLILVRMLEKIEESTDPAIKDILTRLISLYGLWTIDKHHLVILYQGGFVSGHKPTTLIQNAVLKLTKDIKNDAIALVDAVAPPDFAINSVLGKSDGLVYKHLQSAIFRAPNAMSRPSWYQDIINWKSYAQPKL